MIFIADGQRTSRMVLERLVSLLDGPVTVRSFGSAKGMFAAARDEEPPPDLMLVDPVTCAIDGVAFAQCLRLTTSLDEVPLVYVMGAESEAAKLRALKAGVTDFLAKPVSAAEFTARCANLLRLQEQQHQLADRTAWLQRKIQESTREVQAREEETLLRLARAGEYRDEDTGMHILRMARFSRILAEQLGLPAEECDLIGLVAPLHDIGKIGIPDEILLKPARLTPEERRLLQRHTQIGYDILKDSPSKYLQAGAVIALAHHEHYNGGGYPGGLKGTCIPLHARIVAVADVYDALTTPRAYKDPWPIEKALSYLRDERGHQFDADCVDAFFAVIQDIIDIQAKFADDTDEPLQSRSG